MSTIVYRDGVMAADSRAFYPTRKTIGYKAKIHPDLKGGLIGVSTTHLGLTDVVVDWIQRTEANPYKAPGIVGEQGFSAIWARSPEEVYIFDGFWAPNGPIYADYYTVGSGEEVALGALALDGTTAVEAVQIACQVDPMSDWPIYRMEHGWERGLFLTKTGSEFYPPERTVPRHKDYDEKEEGAD